MNLLTINGLTKAYTDKVLFDHADFGIGDSDKVGIIGINGTGKSTLLKILSGLEAADEGNVVKGNQVVINYLPQNPVFEEGTTIYDYVIARNANEGNQWTIEGDAKTILNQLGFEDYQVKVEQLSGGQRKKVALAAALLSTCEILVLDEPTNHLDHNMTSWLEGYLRNYRGALIMVTHDRYFLDRVCNRIVEIDKGKLYSYEENYEGYLEKKALREDMALATQRKHQSILRKEYEWIKRGARARSTKQKSRIDRYEELKNEEKISEEAKVEMSSVSSRLGKKTIELYGLSKAYGENVLLRDYDYIFLRDDRIGIIGPNGCGKSTLLKMICQEVQPDQGHIEWGETVQMGYFSQESLELDPSQKVIDCVRDTAEYIPTSDGHITASQMCERFLFDGTLQHALIGRLSGGEKRRLALLKVLMTAPNVLILDEPTNDLDIQTLRVLEDYLDQFDGILITVSHDRYFLDRVTNRLLVFVGERQIQQYEGSFSEWFEENGGFAKEVKEEKEFKEKTVKTKTTKLKFTYLEQKEYETIEEDIEKLEEQIASLEEGIMQAATDFVKLNELTQEKEAKEQVLDEKMERYIYLTELAEKIECKC